MSNYKINTNCVQAGYTPGNGEPRVVPIAQSTTYKYESAEQMAALFDLTAEGFFYTRLANPTVDAVEKKIAALEGGVLAMLTSSGQSASMMSVLNICSAGEHCICSSALYGGTFNLFNKTMRGMGIEFDFIEPDAKAEEIEKLFKENTRCCFVESLTNPSLQVVDIPLWAELAHKHGVPLIVDNTFPTPINLRPLEWGADIVVHSTSKYLDGHASALGGCVIDGGKFDWKASGKFPGLTTPDETYHGVVYTEQFGNAAYGIKLRTHLMRDIGSMMAPQNAFLLNIGLETLHLRMPRHCENAMAVARWLQKDERIEWVSYPALEDNKYYELASKLMPGGTCGVVSFGVKGGREAATRFLNSLKLAAIVTHVADARTCALHPASTTHRQLNDQELAECGVSPDLIRFSVGIEDVEDIIADIDQALAEATK
ncbi:MAG: O-acetylhomoserine aminocarboxypropyltransferase/cysteine synthase [Ruminococcaceae bacterium]|nr:O-acetylhomoserine aminocarboxypropyltransferase/cysteine synthase [Oscillospiraceae bacterium]